MKQLWLTHEQLQRLEALTLCAAENLNIISDFPKP